MKRIPRIGLATLAFCALLDGAAGAQPVTVANTVPPPFGPIGSGELGDVWQFECPRGGTFSARIDTLDDDGEGHATVDLFFIAAPGPGPGPDEVVGDDEIPCTFPPVCGYQCPAVTDSPCGKNPHTITITGRYEGGCIGGGYELTLEVKDRNGVVVEPSRVRLGGGPKRNLPKWFDPDGARQQGPLIDDESVF